MDALRDLTAAQGCSVDGTAASANPLSHLVNQAMGMGAQKGGPQGHLPPGMMNGPQRMGPPPSHFQELERGMGQGMGLLPGGPMSGATADPRMFQQHAPAASSGGAFAGPMSAAWGDATRGPRHDEFVADFEQQFRAKGQGAAHMLMGPRGGNAHAPMANAFQSRGDQWIQDFSGMNLQEQRGRQWAAEHARGMPPPEVVAQMDKVWRAQQADARNWAQEMAEASAQQEEAGKAASTAAFTDVMLREMASNANMKESGFFDFVSKLQEGELKLENNDVVPGDGVPLTTKDPLAAAWDQAASEAGPASAAAAPNLEAAYEDAATEMEREFQRALAEGNESDLDAVFRRVMEQAGMEATDSSMYHRPSAGEFEQGSAPWLNTYDDEYEEAAPKDQPYVLSEDNPFENDASPFEEGMTLFQSGRLQQAVLAFQACVKKDPAHAEAWRMLGVVHQENDEDKKAIVCLERAVEHDAYHLDALLGLGVSYVNELSKDRALTALKSWVMNNPAFQGLEVKQDAYSDGSLMDDVMQLMLKAAEWAPTDPGVQEVLGVLYNVSREYGLAADAFRKALSARPDDYALWNKLGATLANGDDSKMAVPQYLRAIELRPGYARAHLNLGISYSNIADFANAARSYLRALALSPEAVHIWSYLRIAFTVMERYDLVTLVEKKDVNAFRGVFDF